MKYKKIVPFTSTVLITTLASCGIRPAILRINHKDEAIYNATIDGQTLTNLTWKDSYDAIISKTKVTNGEERNEYLHQAEDLIMSTGAICPIFYFTDTFLMKTNMDGFFYSSSGFKFFYQSTIGQSKEIDVCIGPRVDSIDPAINSAADGANIILHAFEGLFRYKAPIEEKLTNELELGQAASYTKQQVGDEGHVKYIFKLKDNLKFSDGSELKASDFAKSWSRAASGKLGADYAYMFDCIVGYDETYSDTSQYLPLSGVTADDKNKTLEVELVSDIPYFLELTAFPTFVPVKMNVVENENWWTNTSTYIGNGPMKFTKIENENGKSLVAEPNPYYWDGSYVRTNKITFHLTDDDSNQLANYENDSWDFIDGIPIDRVDQLKTRPDFYITNQLGTDYVIFNINDHTLDKVLDTEEKNAEFRKAISLIIDRNYVCQVIGKAGQQPANTFVSKGIIENHNGVIQDWTLRSGTNRDGNGYFKVEESDYENNCNLAVEMIKNLGYNYDERKGKFTNIPAISYLYNEDTTNKAFAEYLQAVLALYGINLTLESQEWAVFLNSRRNGEYTMACSKWIADYNDACSFLDMWTTESGNNDAQFGK